MKPTRGHGDEAADDGAEPERRALEEEVAREAVARLVRGHRRFAAVGRNRWRARSIRAGSASGDRLDPLASMSVVTSRSPEEAEDDAIDGADRHDDHRVDDQADEDARDADREADRPEARAPGMLLVRVAGVRVTELPSLVTLVDSIPALSRAVNDVSIGATGRNSDGFARSRAGSVERDPVLRPAAVDESLHLGGHLDLGRPLARALVGALVGGVDPDLAAEELARRRVVEMVERALGEQDVALRDRRWRRRGR